MHFPLARTKKKRDAVRDPPNVKTRRNLAKILKMAFINPETIVNLPEPSIQTGGVPVFVYKNRGQAPPKNTLGTRNCRIVSPDVLLEGFDCIPSENE